MKVNETTDELYRRAKYLKKEYDRLDAIYSKRNIYYRTFFSSGIQHKMERLLYELDDLTLYILLSIDEVEKKKKKRKVRK